MTRGIHASTNMLGVLVFVGVIVTAGMEMKQKPKSTTIASTSLGEVKSMANEVHQKLGQLHSVIDSLQSKVRSVGLEQGRDMTQDNAGRMRKRFEKLSQLITKLSAQNMRLYGENKVLRQSNGALVDKIAALEKRLNRQAENEVNNGVESWLRQTARELKAFLEENGLEHFSSPRFSPVVAGLVSNGVILLPLCMTSLFLLHYVKQLTVLRMLMALNLFDLGISIAIILSSVLLLGDPLEGLRHISEVNFVFIQIVGATAFWLAIAFLTIAMVQNYRTRTWKICLVELALKIIVSIEYARKVWFPVMDRDDVPIALPGLYYAIYSIVALGCVVLTAWGDRYATNNRRHYRGAPDDYEDSLILVSPQTLSSHRAD